MTDGPDNRGMPDDVRQLQAKQNELEQRIGYIEMRLGIYRPDVKDDDAADS